MKPVVLDEIILDTDPIQRHVSLEEEAGGGGLRHNNVEETLGENAEAKITALALTPFLLISLCLSLESGENHVNNAWATPIAMIAAILYVVLIRSSAKIHELGETGTFYFAALAWFLWLLRREIYIHHGERNFGLAYFLMRVLILFAIALSTFSERVWKHKAFSVSFSMFYGTLFVLPFANEITSISPFLKTTGLLLVSLMIEMYWRADSDVPNKQTDNPHPRHRKYASPERMLIQYTLPFTIPWFLTLIVPLCYYITLVLMYPTPMKQPDSIPEPATILHNRSNHHTTYDFTACCKTNRPANGLPRLFNVPESRFYPMREYIDAKYSEGDRIETGRSLSNFIEEIGDSLFSEKDENADYSMAFGIKEVTLEILLVDQRRDSMTKLKPIYNENDRRKWEIEFRQNIIPFIVSTTVVRATVQRKGWCLVVLNDHQTPINYTKFTRSTYQYNDSHSKELYPDYNKETHEIWIRVWYPAVYNCFLSPHRSIKFNPLLISDECLVYTAGQLGIYGTENETRQHTFERIYNEIEIRYCSQPCFQPKLFPQFDQQFNKQLKEFWLSSRGPRNTLRDIFLEHWRDTLAYSNQTVSRHSLAEWSVQKLEEGWMTPEHKIKKRKNKKEGRCF